MTTKNLKHHEKNPFEFRFQEFPLEHLDFVIPLIKSKPTPINRTIDNDFEIVLTYKGKWTYILVDTVTYALILDVDIKNIQEDIDPRLRILPDEQKAIPVFVYINYLHTLATEYTQFGNDLLEKENYIKKHSIQQPVHRKRKFYKEARRISKWINNSKAQLTKSKMILNR